MIELTVDVDNQSGIAGMIAGIRGQLPFAVSLGLNNIADVAQRAVQTALHGEFTLRHEAFIENTIYRKPGQDFATKTNLSATVRVDPTRDFLAKFEDGGDKVGQHALAIPIIRQDHPAIIIQRDDPRNIKRVMALIEQQDGKNVGPFKKRSAKRAAQQSFFLIHSKSGKTLVLQRDAGHTFVLYDLEHEVPIPASLHFDDIAMAAALAAADDEMGRAFEYAMATAR